MFAYKARYLLITLAKIIPFILCFVVCLSYIETIISLSMNNLCQLDGYTIIETQLSWFVGWFYMYDWYAIILCVILAIATSTCIWNRLAILYLAIHLLFKHFIEQIELEEYQIYMLCIINILINVVLIYKGLKK